MDFLSIANSPALWIIAAICVGTVITQGALYVRMALKNAKPLGISKKECFSAVRSGAIAAIGPSIANALSTISLVAIVGAPIAWIRLSMIGNAATESGAASIGAMAAGTSLGSADFGIQAMSVVWLTMAINGCGWLVMTLLFNHRMGQVRDKISGGDKIWLAIFQATSMIGIISYSLTSYTVKLDASALAAVVGCITGVGALMLSRKVPKLKEWTFGISILAGVVVGYFFL